jgi:hypothetical protein
LVFTNPFSNCGAYFRVGEDHLVVANRLSGDLYASRCPLLEEHQVAAVRRLLGVPTASTVGLRRSWGAYKPKDCSQPPTLSAAFAAANAVAWTSSRASCVVGDFVEHASSVRRAWKGLAMQTTVRIRVAGRADDQYAEFDFANDLADATNHHWPPAEFLRREGGVFVNDGCLSPQPPRTLDVGIGELARWLPLSETTSWGHRSSCEQIPPLSCGTLEQSIFDEPAKRLLALQRAAREELSESRNARAFSDSGASNSPHAEAGAATGRSAPCQSHGACAGCVVPNERRSGSFISVVLLTFGLLYRRRGSHPIRLAHW